MDFRKYQQKHARWATDSKQIHHKTIFHEKDAGSLVTCIVSASTQVMPSSRSILISRHTHRPSRSMYCVCRTTTTGWDTSKRPLKPENMQQHRVAQVVGYATLSTTMGSGFGMDRGKPMTYLFI